MFIPNIKQELIITYSQDRGKKVFCFVTKVANINTNDQFISHIKYHNDMPPNPHS